MANMNISIPLEIITEILYCLPVKSIGRFRCVSKEWLSLTSDPKFIKTIIKTTNRNHIIFTGFYILYSHLFDHHEESLLTPTKFHLQTHDNQGYYNFCGSCDGLVLVHFMNYNDSHCWDRFVLYNPTTRDFMELPFSSSMSDYGEYGDIHRFQTMKGFGYDSLTDDYKVVTTTYVSFTTGAPTSVFVRAYSLRTNTWKLLTDYAYDYSFVDYPYYYCYDNADSCVFVNGFLHWFAEKNSNGLHVIIAFCLADEKFSEVPSPNLCNDNADFTFYGCILFALGGKLAIFDEGVVWLMNEYGKTEYWTKILLCRLDDIQMDRPKVFEDNDRLLVADKDRMLAYDVEKESFGKTIYVWNRKKFRVEGACVESLLSPKFSQG